MTISSHNEATPGPWSTKRLFTVVGGQFGSEAKGHVAAQLARREIERGQEVWAVRVAGHNAGHTSHDDNGVAYPLRTIPCMAVVNPDVKCFIAAGSELAPDVLDDEIAMIEAGGHEIRHRLFIDPEATVIEPRHIDQEGGMHEGIGSTGKGVGAARAERAMRLAERWGEVPYRAMTPLFHSEEVFAYNNIPDGVSIILEGTQGFGLGLHAGMYPFCTSSNTRSIDFLAMAAIDPVMWTFQDQYHPVVVCRTFPIRVAGNSGPLNHETTWEELAVETDGYIQPERTTVTKKVRRVGRWDQPLVDRAIRANGGSFAQMAITFADYLDPSIAGMTNIDEIYDKSAAVRGFLNSQQYHDILCVTTGPQTIAWV